MINIRKLNLSKYNKLSHSIFLVFILLSLILCSIALYGLSKPTAVYTGYFKVIYSDTGGPEVPLPPHRNIIVKDNHGNKQKFPITNEVYKSFKKGEIAKISVTAKKGTVPALNKNISTKDILFTTNQSLTSIKNIK